MNHRQSLVPGASNGTSNQLSRIFLSDDGCRILSTVVSEEQKLLQETKKILEKRVLLDEQYARNLQDLTASADRITWPTNTHIIASSCREVFLQWSHTATTISSNVEQFRRTIIDDLLKELIEQKSDSKRFLDDEKRRYDTEHRKALSDVTDAEKRYQEESKSYATKNTELTKLQSNARKGDDARIKNLKDSVIERRGNLYRAHNEYILKIREYNFANEQYIRKIRNLLIYHEEAQLILNKPWQKLLEAIASYRNHDRDESTTMVDTLRQMIYSIHPQRCYDEICNIHSNLTPITTKPYLFDEIILGISGLKKLESDQFIGDSSTKQDLTQRIAKLTQTINEPIPKFIDQTKDKYASYNGRKTLFEQEQQIHYSQLRKKWEEKLRNELKSKLQNAGYRSDDESDPDSDEELSDRLEDQFYFHGVMPRIQSISQLTDKGDYLVRINEQGKIVLSILWSDPDNPNKLKDGHFIIQDTNSMYSLQPNNISKPTVNELVSFYKRQKLELRDDGTRLIRPIARPDYIINNEEVKTSDVLGKGHFGQVIRGEYRGQTVAVKVLLPSSSTTRDVKERQNFINEALLLQQYKHKNIVKLIGVAAIRDPLMIVMELIEQGSLNTYLKKNDLRASVLTQMCYDIAKGMEYLEKCNVIHRDLAARNCLIDKKGRVKVADFGLSRTLQSDEEYFCQIKEVPVRWWPVEVFEQAPYTSKSDVWSYGVTAWEVFSKAEMPYAHLQRNHLVIEAIKHGDRLKQPEKCPAKIHAIMTTCWLVHPKDRPTFERLVELLKKEKSLF